MKDHVPTRGIRDIRTNASASGFVEALPHKLHMRLCSLEMERYRRDQERKVALQRAAKCEERCRQIEGEVRAIMDTINGRLNESAGGNEPAAAPAVSVPARGKPRTSGGQTLKYLY